MILQISANIWAVHNDRNLFKEPNKFKPERHLDKYGKFVKSKYVIPFSVGPRHCLGEQLARMEVFIFLVSLVQKFRFKPTATSDKAFDEDNAVSGIAFLPVRYEVIAEER